MLIWRSSKNRKQKLKNFWIHKWSKEMHGTFVTCDVLHVLSSSVENGRRTPQLHNLEQSLLIRSCYLTPATPATPASYIKGTATDNLPWKNRLAKVCRISAEFMKIARIICKLHTKNFQFFSRRILTTLVMLLYVPAMHLFSNTYPTACLSLAGFE